MQSGVGKSYTLDRLEAREKDVAIKMMQARRNDASVKECVKSENQVVRPLALAKEKIDKSVAISGALLLAHKVKRRPHNGDTVGIL